MGALCGCGMVSGNIERHLSDKSPPLSIVLEIGAVQEAAPLGAFFGSSADGPLRLGPAGPVVNALLAGMRRES